MYMLDKAQFRVDKDTSSRQHWFYEELPTAGLLPSAAVNALGLECKLSFSRLLSLIGSITSACANIQHQTSVYARATDCPATLFTITGVACVMCNDNCTQS